MQYQPSTQQFQGPAIQPPIQQFQPPIQQFQLPIQQFQPPIQQFQAPVVKAPPPQPRQVQIPVQQFQTPVSFQPQNIAPRQQFQPQAPRPVQPQLPTPVQNPVPQLIQVTAQRPIQQALPPRTFTPIQQTAVRPVQQQQIPVNLASPAVPQFQPPSSGPQYPIGQPPQSQQFFMIYPQAPLPNQRQQQQPNPQILSQKTAPGFVPQQQILASAPQVSSVNPNVPYSYSFQISHPLRQAS